MKDKDGRSVKIGDNLSIAGGSQGKIVIDFENKEALPPFKIEEWEDYHTGIMVEMSNGALYRYESPYYTFKDKTYWYFSLIRPDKTH